MGETKPEGDGEKPAPPVDHGPELQRAHKRLDDLEKNKPHSHSAEHQDHKHEVEPAGDKTTIGRRPDAKGKEGESSSSSSSSDAKPEHYGASILGCAGAIAMVASIAIVLVIVAATVLT
jgi:hypothetical protein